MLSSTREAMALFIPCLTKRWGDNQCQLIRPHTERIYIVSYWLCRPRKMETQTGAVLSQQTVSEEPELPLPTPTTVIGLQSRPRRTSKSWRTTPIPLMIGAAAEELAYVSMYEPQCACIKYNDARLTGMRLLQPSNVPVVQGELSSRDVGVATARRGGARATKAERRENILIVLSTRSTRREVNRGSVQ